MSQPNEPRFEDDFDVDTDPPEQYHQYDWQQFTLEDMALSKGHKYATPIANNRAFYVELKAAYKAGFLEGFSHRFTTNDKVSE